MNLQGKNVLVIGMARSGIGAARLCAKHGAQVTVLDAKPAEQLAEKQKELADCTIRYWLAKEPSEEELAAMDLVVLSPGAAPDQPVVQQAKAHGALVWGEIELAAHFAKAPVIGITGTNGKTTTTTLAGELLQSWLPETKTAGNIGRAYSEIVETAAGPAPVVLELSSFQLEVTESFHPQVSALLNITPDHLNRHKTMEAYVAAKKKVFANQGPEDYAILNYEDADCRAIGQELAAKTAGPQVIYFSRCRAMKRGLWIEEDRILENVFGPVQEVGRVSTMQIFGAHNEENALAAVGCAICFGMPPEKIRTPLEAFKGVEHRIEYVRTVNGVAYYNDSKATNPDSAVKGLTAMRTPVVLIGGGMDKKIPFEEWCGLFDGKVRKLILLGETKEMIAAAAERCGYPKDKIQMVQTLQEAVEAAAAAAQPGDSVLLSPACASWDMFESYEQRGNLFKEMVKALPER